MKYNAFDKIFKKFLTKYDELICEYESVVSESMDNTEFDIYNLFENLLKINKSIDFDEIMFTALVNAIQQKTSVVDTLNSIISQATLNNQSISSTQRYFREVNEIYDKNDNNFDIPFSSIVTPNKVSACSIVGFL